MVSCVDRMFATATCAGLVELTLVDIRMAGIRAGILGWLYSPIEERHTIDYVIQKLLTEFIYRITIISVRLVGGRSQSG